MSVSNQNITKNRSLSLSSIIDGQMVDATQINSSFRGQFINTPAKESEEPIILYSYNNTTAQSINIEGQFSLKLKPGKRIVVREEGISSETNADYNITNFTNKLNNGIINNITRNTLGNYNYHDSLYLYKELIEGFSNVNSPIELYKHMIIKVIEQDYQKKDNELSKTKELLEKDEESMQGYLRSRRVEEKMFKYGFVPYLVYLIISLAVFFSSATMFLIWRIKDASLFNPASVFMVALMSLGWSLTAIGGLISVKKRSIRHEN